VFVRVVRAVTRVSNFTAAQAFMPAASVGVREASAKL